MLFRNEEPLEVHEDREEQRVKAAGAEPEEREALVEAERALLEEGFLDANEGVAVLSLALLLWILAAHCYAHESSPDQLDGVATQRRHQSRREPAHHIRHPVVLHHVVLHE